MGPFFRQILFFVVPTPINKRKKSEKSEKREEKEEKERKREEESEKEQKRAEKSEKSEKSVKCEKSVMAAVSKFDKTAASILYPILYYMYLLYHILSNLFPDISLLPSSLREYYFAILT